MKYTIYTQPGCASCNTMAKELFLTGAEVEVIDEILLGQMEDRERRFRLHEQIVNRGRTDLPVIFANDVLVEKEDIPCLNG